MMATEQEGPLLRLRCQDVEWRLVEGEVVALDLRDSAYFAINASGAVLWELLVEGSTQERLTNLLVDRYGIDPARAVADVRAFLAMLEERDLLAQE